MKTTKKLCAVVLSLVLAFACMTVIPFTGITAAAAGTTYVAKINYANADTWTYLMIETPIPTGTYQFDVDYVTTGSVSARVVIPTDSIPATEIDRTDDGRHITVQFDWTYNGSTAFQIRLRDNDFKGTGVIYFANPVLKRVENGVLTGDNEVWDYSKQYSEIGSSITKSWAWRGEWYRTNTASNITVEADSAGRFPSQDSLATTATTAGVYIGKTGSAQQAATVFFPLTSKYSGSYKLQDGCQVKFTCKVRMLESGSRGRPIVGFLRHRTTTKDESAHTYETVDAVTWVDNDNKDNDTDKNYSVYDAATGTLTVYIVLSDIPGDANTYLGESRSSYHVNRSKGTGGIWGAITIGNTAFNNNWSRQPDWNSSFIISNPSMVAIKDSSGNDVTGSSGEMLQGFGAKNEQGIYGLAGRYTVGNGTDAMNHPMRAPANKWSVLGNNPDLVKFVTVDDSYLSARRAYVCNRETSNTRQYYTCAAFGSKKFERFGIGCYSVIPDDVNKKAVVIGSDGTNKVANIFLPLDTHRYFQCVGKTDGNYDWRDGYTQINGNNGGDVFYHISFNAKRLSGSGQPIVGRLYACDWGWNGAQFEAGMNAAYNNSDATAQASYCTSSYNATTGAFTAVVRFNKGYLYDLTQTGYNEVLTIGNAEHTNTANSFDSNAFGSSFVITDISIQVYDADNSTLLDSEAAPQMVAGNYWFDPSTEEVDNHTSQHYFESSGTKNHNDRPTGLWNMPLDTWGCDGAQSQVSVVNRSDCLAANHTLTHNAATDTTREYWRCATCGKNYADPYACETITDTTATKKMIVIKGSGSVPESVVLPLNIVESSGTHYYKFTCDMEVFGNELPIISLLQGSWWGGNGAKTPDDPWFNNSSTPSSNLYASYNASTHKYEAVIRIDHSSSVFSYANAITGAYAGLLLGNGRPIGAGGYTEEKYFTSFAFANPHLYKLTDASNANSTTGSDLCAPISDKTVDVSTNYPYTASTRYNSENTMYLPNNPLAAPLGKWSVSGVGTAWTSVQDIPSGFFSGSATKHMLRATGSVATETFATQELFLKAGETYQFDIDYRDFGATPVITLESSTGSYTAVSETATASNVADMHKSVRFTMPAGAKTTGTGNFRLTLGQTSSGASNKSTVYFANATLKLVSGGNVTGRNLLINNAFEGGSGDLTSGNLSGAMFGWAPNSSVILDKTTKALETIPSGFFTGNAVTLKGAQVELDGSMNLGFNLILPAAVSGDSGAYVRIQDLRNGAAHTTDIPLSEATVESGVYKFKYPLMVKQFNESVNMTVYSGSGSMIKLYSTGGNNYSASGLDYSVSEYANKMKTGGSTAQMQTLASAIADFGAATQIYFGYNQGTLAVSSDTTAVTASALSSYQATTSGTMPDGVTGKSIQLNLIDKTTLRITFKTDKTIGFGNGSYTCQIDGNTVVAGPLADGSYRLEVADIEADELATDHTFSISYGGKTYTVTASALTYARASVVNGNAARQNLGKALYRYYNAAHAYFG